MLTGRLIQQALRARHCHETFTIRDERAWYNTGMANPVIEAEKVMLGHGLDPEVSRWTRRIAKKAEKKWADEVKHGHANDDHASANDNEHQVPVLATFEQLFTEAWQNADKPIAPEHAELYHLAEIEARRELHRSLDTNATLTLAPDDYMRLYSAMQDVAHAMVRETQGLAAGSAKTQIGSNVFRHKVKQSVQKFIGDKHGVSHAQCSHDAGGQQKPASTVPTLTHVCGIELRPPTLFHSHNHQS